MIPSGFEYFAPASVAEAVSLLQQHGDEAKLLAGGHSLLPALKLRLAAPGVLIDISNVKELQGIKANGNVTIGAGTTYHTIATSEAVKSHCAVLAACVAQIGDIQVRNRGTIGGSIAHSDPAADLTAVVLALGAQITVQGPKGTRTVNADDLFVDMLTTSLDAGEVLTSISVPSIGKGAGASYEKLRHPASRYAIVGVAAYVTTSGGTVSSARVAVTGAGAKAVRQSAVEAAISGTVGGADDIAAAADKAGDGIDYLGDIHASAEYRAAMVKVYTQRALAAALAQAHG